MIFQTIADCTVSAHGQPGDKGIFPSVREWEHLPGDLHQLMSDQFPVVIMGSLLVYIEHIVTGRHDHSQVLFLRPSLDIRARYPVRIIPENAVQEI